MVHPIRITRFASRCTQPLKAVWLLPANTGGARAIRPLDANYCDPESWAFESEHGVSCKGATQEVQSTAEAWKQHKILRYLLLHLRLSEYNIYYLQAVFNSRQSQHLLAQGVCAEASLLYWCPGRRHRMSSHCKGLTVQRHDINSHVVAYMAEWAAENSAKHH